MSNNIQPLNHDDDAAQATPVTSTNVLTDKPSLGASSRDEQTSKDDAMVAKVNTKDRPEGVNDDADRALFISQLIASKKYFVNVKQKSHNKGLTLGFNTRGKKPKPKKVSAMTAKVPPEVQKAAAEAKAKNIKLAVGMVVIWIVMFIGVDTGLLNVGFKLPFSVFNRDENANTSSNETVEFELITE